MTKQEYEESFAKENNTTVEWLHENDLHAVESDCDCGVRCGGWGMNLNLYDIIKIASQRKEDVVIPVPGYRDWAVEGK